MSMILIYKILLLTRIFNAVKVQPNKKRSKKLFVQNVPANRNLNLVAWFISETTDSAQNRVSLTGRPYKVFFGYALLSK